MESGNPRITTERKGSKAKETPFLAYLTAISQLYHHHPLPPPPIITPGF
jgi:hypothetical protein